MSVCDLFGLSVEVASRYTAVLVPPGLINAPQ